LATAIAIVGVPEITPVEAFSESPGGRAEDTEKNRFLKFFVGNKRGSLANCQYVLTESRSIAKTGLKT